MALLLYKLVLWSAALFLFLFFLGLFVYAAGYVLARVATRPPP